MYKLGLKLYSTNKDYVEPARKLYETGCYDFIELLSVPDSYTATINWWKLLGIPFTLHAPHFGFGVNLGRRESLEFNMRIANEVRLFSDALNARHCIYHPGTDSDINESARQFSLIKGQNVLVENKPYTTMDGKHRCIGTSYEDIKKVMDVSGVGFCLDIGHCIAYAESIGEDWHGLFKQFLSLKPAAFHVSDGFLRTGKDTHEHIGKGNYNWSEILPFIPKNSLITIETKKDYPDNLDDFAADARTFRKLYELFQK
jgi:endonuclease IV